MHNVIEWVATTIPVGDAPFIVPAGESSVCTYNILKTAQLYTPEFQDGYKIS